MGLPPLNSRGEASSPVMASEGGALSNGISDLFKCLSRDFPPLLFCNTIAKIELAAYASGECFHGPGQHLSLGFTRLQNFGK